jgi:type IV pilus assembly protein PilE
MKSSHKNGFTIIELLIVVGIFGVLGAVGTPMYQGYLTSTKENTAKDNLTTIAFMQSDHNREFGQYLPCPKKTLNTAQIDKEFFSGGGLISGGNGAHGDPLARDYEYELRGGCTNFMAYAFRTASVPDAKCFKVDSRRTISTITCPKAVTKVANCTLKSGTRISGGSTGKTVSCASGKIVIKPLSTKNFSNYKPPSAASKGNGVWTMVDSNGKQVKGRGGTVCSMSVCGPGGSFYKSGSGSSQHGQVDPSLYKYVFEQPRQVTQAAGGGMSYNFSTNIWTTKSGQKFDSKGNRVK